ncbi:MAG: cyclopropane-fatty-acyl-phospholipid synthase family protein [Pseudorhodoplanes sp.]|uniref:SAM-dependent methyltransferase n=1 Tax=Pseudorhodoplanes sp. TaxID=1934341 RepID=UPI003D14BB6A
MGLVTAASKLVERVPIPDAVTRTGIELLCGRTARSLSRMDSSTEVAFALEMAARPIAIHTQDANAQHYEVPADFFALVLGPHRKYSCCYYDGKSATLADAEERALQLTVEHADLRDGQSILELGCGWGSLSLHMAGAFPNARIVAVSNSQSQREFIESEARLRQIRNLRVMTCDMNAFSPEQKFDRVVSVEMFEHMSNWRLLFARVRSWMEPDARLFMHVFSHRRIPYRYEVSDEADWIARYFFTGGIMPSHNLPRHFSDLFAVEADWLWDGTHYERTALDWLANFDARREEVTAVLGRVYGSDTRLWLRRWRIFFLATAGMFGHAGGREWGVSHYRMRAV